MNRQYYLDQLKGHTPDQPPVSNADWLFISQAPTGLCWRVVGAWHLSPQQNGGNHHCYADLLDKDGNVLEPPITQVLGYKWEGQRENERAEAVPFDKRPPEPASNLPIWKGQILTVWVADNDRVADSVRNLTTDLPDEPPGNTRYHHSYYIVWQQFNTSRPPDPPHDQTIEQRVTTLEAQVKDLYIRYAGLEARVSDLEAAQPPPKAGINLFGLHEPGGEQLIRDAGRSGWLLFTEALGCDANDHSGKDFRQWAKEGITAIVRLNNGYEPAGTIPKPDRYENFAQRCANFCAASQGASRYIIGNEPNLPVERPEGEPISPQLYVQCYQLCRDKIKAVQPDAEVIIAPVGPWNTQTIYAGNESGDWVQYFSDVLALCDLNLDGVALHTYTHGPDPALISSEARMDPPFSMYHYEFRAYRDFIWSIGPSLWDLPIYITETDQNDPWLDHNNGWVQAAYHEIDAWNQANYPQICALILYRWPRIDQWYIESKQGVIRDFQAAMQNDYRPNI